MAASVSVLSMRTAMAFRSFCPSNLWLRQRRWRWICNLYMTIYVDVGIFNILSIRPHLVALHFFFSVSSSPRLFRSVHLFQSYYFILYFYFFRCARVSVCVCVSHFSYSRSLSVLQRLRRQSHEFPSLSLQHIGIATASYFSRFAHLIAVRTYVSDTMHQTASKRCNMRLCVCV